MKKNQQALWIAWFVMAGLVLLLAFNAAKQDERLDRIELGITIERAVANAIREAR